MPAKPFAAPTPVTSEESHPSAPRVAPGITRSAPLYESGCECGSPDGVHAWWCWESDCPDMSEDEDADFDIDPEIPEEF